jgi:hypothetical protein
LAFCFFAGAGVDEGRWEATKTDFLDESSFLLREEKWEKAEVKRVGVGERRASSFLTTGRRFLAARVEPDGFFFDGAFVFEDALDVFEDALDTLLPWTVLMGSTADPLFFFASRSDDRLVEIDLIVEKVGHGEGDFSTSVGQYSYSSIGSANKGSGNLRHFLSASSVVVLDCYPCKRGVK